MSWLMSYRFGKSQHSNPLSLYIIGDRQPANLVLGAQNVSLTFYLSVISIDNVYIDGSCELLIGRSINKLLAEHLVLLEIPKDNVLLSCLYKSGSHDQFYEPHDPSMYTLSMVYRN